MFIKDLNYWLLHKVIACVIFHKTEFNRVSAQDLFLMWCIHHKQQVSWTYQIFNQLLACALRKDVPLTHSHVITIIAKSLNVDLSNFNRIIECSYFTKKAFIHGKDVDSSFCLIPTKMRSCWKGIEQPPSVEEHYVEEEEETNPEEEEPTYRPFSDVPMLPCPI